LVSAIKSEFSDEGEPSVLLTKLGGTQINHVSGFPVKALSLSALVAEIRKTGQSQDADDDFKKALAKRLHKLANTKDAFGRDISQAADPQNWWATFKPSASEIKLAQDDQPVSLSGSGLATLRDCGLKWFLEKKAGANIPRQNAASIGSIVHALAQGLSNGEIDPNFEALKEMIDKDPDCRSKVRFFLGYSGWSKDQLKNELAENSWIVADNIQSQEILDTYNDELWKYCLEKQGKRFQTISKFPLNPNDN
jgi:hypothetical protein